MQRTLRPFWVTVRIDACRTRDHRILADSTWAAGWLWRQLHPGQTVVHVREVKGGGDHVEAGRA
jgi:hypothetical protein